MYELIKIEIKDGQQLVSGRSLHEFLEVGTPYDKWFPRMREYGFEEGKDFSTFLSESTGGRPATNHWLTIAMAKEISMLQRNERGKQARQYFIKCEEAWNNEDMILARALQIQNKKIIGYTKHIKMLEDKIEEQKPQVIFAKAVATSNSTILVGDLAKLLKQNGINIGQNRLFEWLRNNEYLICRKGSSYNMPTQKSMNLKLFEIKETAITHSDGHITTNKTVKVTGKGQQYFINFFLKDKIA